MIDLGQARESTTEFEVYRAASSVQMVLIDTDDDGDLIYLEMSPEEAHALGERLVAKAAQDYEDEEIQ